MQVTFHNYVIRETVCHCKRRLRKLLLKCIELPRYAHWSFDDYFNETALADKAEGDVEVCCQTPVQWIEAGILGPNSSSVWHRQDVEITWMCEMSDMFSENGTRNPFHHEVFVMDVILNRAICKPAAVPTSGSVLDGKKAPPVIDPDWVAVDIDCNETMNWHAAQIDEGVDTSGKWVSDLTPVHHRLIIPWMTIVYIWVSTV